MSAMYAWMDIHSLVQMAPWLTLTNSLARSTVVLSLSSFVHSVISPLALVDFAFRASLAISLQHVTQIFLAGSKHICPF